MPVVDFEARISSRFSCRQPADAAPGEKRQYQLPEVFNVQTPHVRVDCVMGTRGTFVERIDSNYYQMHIPDSPVMLGESQSATYLAGMQACSWGRKRLIALGAALAVGAALGVIVGSCGLGVAALLHLVWTNTFGAVTFWHVVGVNVGFASVGATLCAASDMIDWSDARKLFARMHRMSACAQKLDAYEDRDAQNVESAELINFARQSTSWVVQQAGLELEAARLRAGIAPPQQRAS